MDTSLLVAILTLALVALLMLGSWALSAWRAHRRRRAAEAIEESMTYDRAELAPSRLPLSTAGNVVGIGRVGAKSGTQPGRTLQNRTHADDDTPMPGPSFEIQAVQDMLAMEQASAPAAEFHGGGGDFGGGGASGSWDSASPASDPSPDCSSSDTNCASSD